MSRFCDRFSFFILDAILGRSSSSLGTGRRLTVHSDNPGESGTAYDITLTIFNTNYLTVPTFTFDAFASYDSANNRFYILNTSDITSNQVAVSAGTVYWITIWDDSPTPIPIVRASVQTPLFIGVGSPLQLFAGQLLISARNTGQDVANAILRCVWADNSFNLTLGNFQLGLFSSISGVNISNEITGNTAGLNRIGIDKTQFVTNTIPRYSYPNNATWGFASSAGTSNAFGLLDNTNKLISYQQFTFSWFANTPIGIQANNFFLGVD